MEDIIDLEIKETLSFFMFSENDITLMVDGDLLKNEDSNDKYEAEETLEFFEKMKVTYLEEVQLNTKVRRIEQVLYFDRSGESNSRINKENNKVLSHYVNLIKIMS